MADVDAADSAFGTVVPANDGPAALICFTDAENAGAEEDAEARQVRFVASIGFERSTRFAIELKVSDWQTIENLPCVFEREVMEFVRHVSVHHHLESDFADGLPRSLAYPVLVLMAGCSEGSFDAVLS